MRPTLGTILVLGFLTSACRDPSSSDDDVDTTSQGETADTDSTDTDTDAEGESDGTESLLGETCTPALGNCDPGVLCCSSDPAALDLDDLAAFVLPAYVGSGVDGGLPLFADANNDASRRGICVGEGEVPISLQGAPGCPFPCNPQWSDSDVAEVCGAGTVCCQDVELDMSDCVFDPSLGGAGCWRGVTGFDIVGLGGLEATQWGTNEHTTHQDPGLAADGACETVVAGLPPEVDAAAVRTACQQRLTVANQRGMCLSSSACPYAQPTYVDACEQLNATAGLTGC